MKWVGIGIVFGLGVLGAPATSHAQSNFSRDSSDGSSDSQSSDDSSQSSGDSSQSSDDSSANSNESSADSNDSSDNSVQESSDGSSQQTSDESSNGSSRGDGARVLAWVLVSVVVVAAVVGVVLSVNASGEDEDGQHTADEERLRRFIVRNHTQLTTEVVAGDGPLLRAWTTQLGLNPSQAARWRRSFEGSAPQTAMLTALAGKVDRADATRFARGLGEHTQREIGAARFEAMLTRFADAHLPASR